MTTKKTLKQSAAPELKARDTAVVMLRKCYIGAPVSESFISAFQRAVRISLFYHTLLDEHIPENLAEGMTFEYNKMIDAY